jgi:hypothetical protein
MGFKSASNNFEGFHSISTKSLMNTRDVDGFVCSIASLFKKFSLIVFESPWADFSGQEVLLVVVVLSCNINKAWRDYIKRRRKVWQHHLSTFF